MDPASIAFAQLAEEYRRAGQLDEAVATCRFGLTNHPEYLSARVTLGRALLALGRLDEAGVELHRVLASVPDNLAAVRALAETCRRQGLLHDALAHYTTALGLAPNDPDLERVVRDLSHTVADAEHLRSAAERQRDVATIAALQRWLEAIDATRADRRA
jgi:tetratricopeptide (TPR) repeat protein